MTYERNKTTYKLTRKYYFQPLLYCHPNIQSNCIKDKKKRGICKNMNQELPLVLCLVQSYFGVWFLKPEDKWRLFSFFDHFSSQIRSVSQTLKCDVFNQSLKSYLQKKSGLFLSDNISLLYMETFCNQIWLFELEKAQLENFLSVPEVCLFLNKISHNPWPWKLRRRNDTSLLTKVDSANELPYITRDVSYAHQYIR